MAVTLGQLVNPTPAFGEVGSLSSNGRVPEDAPRYRNKVWDTQKSGSDKTHYWITSSQPDSNGLFYDGPGVFGVSTSGFSALKIKEQGLINPAPLISSNLWAPPDRPHKWDYEFDESTLSSDWYNYVNSSVYGTISYNTVDTYDASFTGGTVVRVTVNSPTRRSWALVQPPENTWTIIGRKFASIPTNLLIVARMKWLHYYFTSGTGHDRSCGLFILPDTSGEPDLNNRVNVLLNDHYDNKVRAAKYRITGGTLYDYSESTDVHEKGQALEYVALHKLGTTYHSWVGTAAGNWIWLGSLVQSVDMAHIGFWAQTAATDRPGAGVYGIDFMRFYETENFLF